MPSFFRYYPQALRRKFYDHDRIGWKIQHDDHLWQGYFQIQGKDGDEFSYIPHIERDKFITLSQFTLKEIIRQTIFSISPNDSNKMMTGELMEVTGNELKLVSLDGHRMSIRKVALKNSTVI